MKMREDFGAAAQDICRRIEAAGYATSVHHMRQYVELHAVHLSGDACRTWPAAKAAASRGRIWRCGRWQKWSGSKSATNRRNRREPTPDSSSLKKRRIDLIVPGAKTSEIRARVTNIRVPTAVITPAGRDPRRDESGPRPQTSRQAPAVRGSA